MAAPTPKLHIPKLGKHKASGQAVVRLNGKDIYCGTHNSPQAQAAYDRIIS